MAYRPKEIEAALGSLAELLSHIRQAPKRDETIEEEWIDGLDSKISNYGASRALTITHDGIYSHSIKKHLRSMIIRLHSFELDLHSMNQEAQELAGVTAVKNVLVKRSNWGGGKKKDSNETPQRRRLRQVTRSAGVAELATGLYEQAVTQKLMNGKRQRLT